jgi:hypothetical protein
LIPRWIKELFVQGYGYGYGYPKHDSNSLSSCPVFIGRMMVNKAYNG